MIKYHLTYKQYSNMDFVGVFGLILIIISLIIFYNAPFKAENENCPEDVKGAK